MRTFSLQLYLGPNLFYFCEDRFAGLSPWFAPVCGGYVGVGGVGVGGGGLHFGLVRRAFCIFASLHPAPLPMSFF
jgi:hypothetical protein